jgi:hypothetical protein
MIPANDAKTSRIIRLCAQILRAYGNAKGVVLLKALFNDRALIFAEKCTHSASY